MTDPLNRVPFPPAGEGACLRYRTADYVELRNKYGEPKLIERRNPETGFMESVWETFTTRIETAIFLHEPGVIVECLKRGLKQEDGRKPLPKIDFDDLPFSLVECVEPIRDALVLAVTNEPYAKLLATQRAVAERNARLREKGVEFNDEDDGPDPSTALMTSASSGESSGSDTPPD